MSKDKVSLKHYVGVQNPSGAVALNAHTFIVGDDELNQLQIFDKAITHYPLQTIQLSCVFPGMISDSKGQELDLEGATELQGILFWIGSHSTNCDGKFQAARHTLLGIRLEVTGNSYWQAQAVGKPYKNLLQDLKADARFDNFQLALASAIAPKDIGGLSIEGLTATPEGTLLIGLRNPLHDGKVHDGDYRHGKALLIELLNPVEVLTGAVAEFGAPISLDLEGNGIRDIAWSHKQKYLIVAGPYQSKVASQLFRWSRKSGKVKAIAHPDLGNLNLEAAVFYPGEHQQVQLFSDDGKLKHAEGFRSIELHLD